MRQSQLRFPGRVLPLYLALVVLVILVSLINRILLFVAPYATWR